MAKNNEEGGKPTKMVDIAATLLQQSPAGGQETPENDQVDEDVLDAVQTAEDDPSYESDEDEEDYDSPTGGEADDDDETLESSDEEGDDTEGDKQPDEDDHETDYLDIDDGDLITVMVDDEEQEVSIGDLKKAFSGEGAIEKRLQQVTETRNRAMSEHTQALEKLAADERNLTSALDSLDDNLFKGVIPPPSDDLRHSNPDQYLRHKEAYDNDQRRIAEAKKTIDDKRAEIENQRNERLQEYAQKAAEVITREIPELADPKTADRTYKSMAETAMAYGYTQQEVNAALDPRMFMLVRDAMKYRQMMDKTKERNPKDLQAQKTKKVKRLRSGNTQSKNRARRADQNRKKVVERARQTGKPKDVAATLLVPKG